MRRLLGAVGVGSRVEPDRPGALRPAQPGEPGAGGTVRAGEPHPGVHRGARSALGALRRGVRLPLPGGDDFGSRPIDYHLAGLEALGAPLRGSRRHLEAVADDGLLGADISLEFPSVGATENIVMAAMLAKGTTILDNAAREPEIVDLCQLLVGMGAQIEGIGSPTVVVHGVTPGDLHGTAHRVVADRVEAATYLAAVGLAGGEIVVRDARAAHMEMCCGKFAAMGLHDRGGRGRAAGRGPERRLRSIDVATLPYPGVATDYKPLITAMLTVADGVGIVTENLFAGRFRYVDELVRMGADIRTDDHHAVVRGVAAARRAPPVRAHDIRAGAALVVAGSGRRRARRTIDGAHHVDRGYEDLVGKLRDPRAPTSSAARADGLRLAGGVCRGPRLSARAVAGAPAGQRQQRTITTIGTRTSRISSQPPWCANIGSGHLERGQDGFSVVWLSTSNSPAVSAVNSKLGLHARRDRTVEVVAVDVVLLSVSDRRRMFTVEPRGTLDRSDPAGRGPRRHDDLDVSPATGSSVAWARRCSPARAGSRAGGRGGGGRGGDGGHGAAGGPRSCADAPSSSLPQAASTRAATAGTSRARRRFDMLGQGTERRCYDWPRSPSPVARLPTGHTAAHTGRAERAQSVRQQVEETIEAIRPALQADGGDIVLREVDEDTGVVTVTLVGACGTCPASTRHAQGRHRAHHAATGSTASPKWWRSDVSRGAALASPAACSTPPGPVTERALARLLSMVERGGERRPRDRSPRLPARRSGLHRGITGAPGRRQVDADQCAHRPPAVARSARWRCSPSTRRRRSPVGRSSATVSACRTTPPTRRCSSARWPPGATSAGWRWPHRRPSACSTPSGKPWVLVETVGVGQVEVEIAGQADTTVVVVNPGWGDAVQANKAGPHGDRRCLRHQQGRPHRRRRRPGATSSSCSTCRTWASGGRRSCRRSATDGTGVSELWEAVQAHRTYVEKAGQLERRRERPPRRGAAPDRRQPPRHPGPGAVHGRRRTSELEREVLARRSTRGPPPTSSCTPSGRDRYRRPP